MQVTIVLAARHLIMRLGLANLLNADQRFRLLAHAEDTRSLEAALRRSRADIVLVDSAILRIEGSGGLRELTQTYTSSRFLLLSFDNSPCCAVEADFAPIIDPANLQALQGAIENLLAGDGRRVNAHEGTDGEKKVLTRRENEILLLVAQGHSSGQIGKLLFISKRTVELHRYHISKKLGLRSPLDLAKYAIREGLIPVYPE